jgi:Fe-S-cluster containining protein
MRNPCIEAGCHKTLCCKDNHILRVTDAEVQAFISHIHFEEVSSGSEMHRIAGMANIYRWAGHTDRFELSDKSGVSDNTTYIHKNLFRGYDVVNIGPCPHLTAMGCNIYSHRPGGCRNFDFDSRECKNLRRNHSEIFLE